MNDVVSTGDAIAGAIAGGLLSLLMVWIRGLRSSKATDGSKGMTPDERARLERLETLLAGNGIDAEGQPVTGEDVVRIAAERGVRVLDSLSELHNQLAALAGRLTFVEAMRSQLDGLGERLAALEAISANRKAVAAAVRDIADLVDRRQS